MAELVLGVPALCVRYLGMLHTFYGMQDTLEAAALAQRQVADMLRAAILKDRSPASSPAQIG